MSIDVVVGERALSNSRGSTYHKRGMGFEVRPNECRFAFSPDDLHGVLYSLRV